MAPSSVPKTAVWLRNLARRGRDRNRLWSGHDPLSKAKFIAASVRHCLPHAARHLDIACGSGQILLALRETGCRVVGLELSARRLTVCRQQDLPVINADMTAPLPVRDGAIDVVTLISSLEHVADPAALVGEIGRILSPHGVVVIQIPNPLFPIDLHYFLPFYGYLPPSLRRLYRRLLAGRDYAIDYHTTQMSKRSVRRVFAGYTEVYAEDFVYPAEVAPDWLRPFYSLYRFPLLRRLFPTGHLFVYCKPWRFAPEDTNMESGGWPQDL
jgi:SAM-dependent methyltransferase